MATPPKTEAHLALFVAHLDSITSNKRHCRSPKYLAVDIGNLLLAYVLTGCTYAAAKQS